MLERAKEIVRDIAAETDSIILMHSLSGKDSIALLDLCAPHFERIVCVYMYVVPDLDHIKPYYAYAASKYPNTEWAQVPHYGLYSWIKYGYMGVEKNPKQRLWKLADIIDKMRERTGVEWCCLGFKQTDSMDEELAGLGSAVIGINGPFTTTAVECRNCIFQDNSSPVAGTASHEGGSCAFIKEGYLKLKNCKFLGNSANSRGGAIRAIGKTSVIFMDNCFFSGNTITGQWGSAVQLSDGVVCANNCTFVDNVGAGCPVNGGGAFFLSSNTIIENRPANGTNDAAFRCESKADRGSTLINNLIINLNPEGSALILNSSGTYKSLGYNVIGTVALGSGCNDPIVTLDYKAESVIDGELDGYCWKWDITQIQENLKGYAVADEVYDAAIGFDPSAYCGISVVGRAFATWVTPNAFAYDCRGNVRGDDGFQPGSYDPNLD